MNAAEQCAQTAREQSRPAGKPADGEDPAAEVAGLAESLDAYGTALGELARALAEDLSEQAP